MDAAHKRANRAVAMANAEAFVEEVSAEEVSAGEVLAEEVFVEAVFVAAVSVTLVFRVAVLVVSVVVPIMAAREVVEVASMAPLGGLDASGPS